MCLCIYVPFVYNITSCACPVCTFTLPRELYQTSILANLLWNMVNQTLHVWCNIFSLVTLQSVECEEISNPLLRLCQCMSID